MTIRLILVSSRPEANQAYRDNIQDTDVTLEVVDSFIALYQGLSREAYHGVLIDMPTKIKAPQEEKELVNEVLDRFPVIQLGWDANSRNIRSFFYGQSKGSGKIQDFITHECRRFSPARARFEKRLPVHFNVQLLGVVDSRTVTINVSRGGCFIYAVGAWREGEPVHLVVSELENQTPIVGEIRWGVRWGTPMKMPGFGLRFQKIADDQHMAMLKRAIY